MPIKALRPEFAHRGATLDALFRAVDVLNRVPCLRRSRAYEGFPDLHTGVAVRRLAPGLSGGRSHLFPTRPSQGSVFSDGVGEREVAREIGPGNIFLLGLGSERLDPSTPREDAGSGLEGG